MKRWIMILAALLMQWQAYAQGFTKAEYFFDTDPGIGNGIPIAINGTSDTSAFTASIPTATLLPGFHFLGLRVQHNNDGWGLNELRGFYVSSFTTDVTDIINAEYFIDSDPGEGNANTLSVGNSGGTVSFAASVPLGSLTPGFHMLAIRTQDNNGNWGLFENRGFYISAATNDAADINAAEFFIDSDPGAGNGTTMTIGASGSTVSLVATIPTQNLAPGFHVLAVRTRGSDNVWGLFEQRTLYISTQTTDATDITAAEYFIDTDPGVGNGSSLTIPSPDSTIIQSFTCALPAGLTNGTHFIAIRTMDADGNWGLFQADSFVISNTLALHGLQLSAYKQGNEIELNWNTLSEHNTSYFIIERSKNGSDFTPIGRVYAKGSTAGQTTYRFTDFHPEQGVNFYRIKEAATDQSYGYSNISTVLFSNTGITINVYPNPAADRITIAAEKEGDYRLQVYNSAGQLCYTGFYEHSQLIPLDVRSLASGNYLVRISDGASVQSASFTRK